MIKSKRGRKPKIKPTGDLSNNVQNTIVEVQQEKPPPKKRGRKPKGGKIIQTSNLCNKMIHIMPNIILHLQCIKTDVNNTFNNNNCYDPHVISVESYEKSNHFNIGYTEINSSNEDIIKSNNLDFDTDNLTIEDNQKTATNISLNNNTYTDLDNNKIYTKNISKKLKELSYKLRNNICDTKSACFWCTCKFNTSNIYIPSTLENDIVNVYGCFCSPECACAYLMNENIDSSIKFERYTLLNYLYGSIYNYTKNIKPAPSPYYILDIFCGNLSIEEYRSRFTDDNLLIIANKPQRRILPELFEENSMSTNDMRYNINKYS